MSDKLAASDVDRRNRVLTGDLWGTMFRLALPVLLQQFLSFLVGFYDVYLSGRISSDATTAIGLAAYVGWMASMMFNLVGIGTTALVARAWGAARFEEANQVTNRSLSLSLILGVAAYLAIYLTAPAIALMVDTDEARGIVVRYLRIDGLGHLAYSVSLIGSAALRGAGDMRTPMFILGLVSLLNVVASRTLVYGLGPIPALGIDGIVLGTVIARFSGGVLMFWALARGISGLSLERNELTIRGPLVRRILRVGLPAFFDGAMMLSGQFVFLWIISRLATGELSSHIFAAHFVGIQVEAITYLPAVAWAQSASTMVGQCLGGGKPDRAFKAGHAAAGQCALLAIPLALLFFFGAEGIYRLMHELPEVHAIGIPAFRLLAFAQVPLVFAIVYVGALRGAGDARYPMWITLVGVYGVRLPVAWVCGVAWQGGLYGAWIGMCADIGVRAALVMLRYHRGQWLKTEV